MIMLLLLIIILILIITIILPLIASPRPAGGVRRVRGRDGGWSDNHFDNLPFRLSLETSETTTCAAEHLLMSCVFSF